MLSELYEDHELDSDTMLELPGLGGMHEELINESIRDQIESPGESRVNFIDEYFEKVNDMLAATEENPESHQIIVSDAVKFCVEVLRLIDEKFDIDLDEESLLDNDLDEIKSLTYAAYDFFVIHYFKNVKKFFVKYIILHMDDIDDVLADMKDRNDVVSNSLKNKLTDPRMVTILSNLKSAIEYIDSLDLDGYAILDVFNQDKYEIFILNSALNRNLISPAFSDKFFAPVSKGAYDDDFNNVFLSIQSSLMKKFVKMQDEAEDDD